MEAKEVTYIELYKLKSGLQRQIKELEDLMIRIMPNDFDTLNKLASDITLGVYDYPIDGLIKEKIIFTLGQLKTASVNEILRYMKIVGEKDIDHNNFESDLKKQLQMLSARKVLSKNKAEKDPNEIKYGVL